MLIRASGSLKGGGGSLFKLDQMLITISLEMFCSWQALTEG